MKNSTKIIALLVSAFICSCAARQDVVYFQDITDYETLVNQNTSETKFKVDDVVSIFVSTLDPEASAPFNLFRGAQEGGIVPEQVSYIVDKNGEIDFPVIGKLKIEGLSPIETRALLREKLSDYLKDPIINIRLQNFTVTVLGAVNRPGTYPVNGEQITIFEALGLAGDIVIKGRRDNVRVIRDFGDTKVYHTINLNNKDAFKSPAYYLTQNDLVYVEPNKSGKTESSLDQRASIAVSIASVLITSAVILISRN
ncbi:MAG: sugar transporter [Muricauda sp.]|nr:polysaccharide biosynthesis/export family protein [Allomuricauda sp.]MBC30829.1 sugar transporter [Allomuricauda sp.]|tara:strand:+ start:43807 stop:44568 length:762 start_codon:yes stop_codon:yes gene_type:complete